MTELKSKLSEYDLGAVKKNATEINTLKTNISNKLTYEVLLEIIECYKGSKEKLTFSILGKSYTGIDSLMPLNKIDSNLYSLDELKNTLAFMISTKQDEIKNLENKIVKKGVDAEILGEIINLGNLVFGVYDKIKKDYQKEAEKNDVAKKVVYHIETRLAFLKKFVSISSQKN